MCIEISKKTKISAPDAVKPSGAEILRGIIMKKRKKGMSWLIAQGCALSLY
jgi:hypothetical protein